MDVSLYRFRLQFVRRSRVAPIVLLFVLSLGLTTHSVAVAQQASVARVVGTIQDIAGSTLTVLADAGTTTSVSVANTTKFMQIEPGKTDLKEATPIAFSDLQPGDRVLVRGVFSEDRKTLGAASIIAVKKAAIADKQAKERAEWQRGVGGLVKSTDAAAQSISITTNGFSANKELVVHVSKGTVLRRYAPDSTHFDAATPAPFSEIRPGDQLRARGTRSTDGQEFDATEIVSGTFRSIAGIVTAADASAGTLVVQDLASKSPVTLKITAESQMRKLPAAFAEGLATRLRGQAASAAPGAAPSSVRTGATPDRTPTPTGASAGAPGGGPGGPNAVRGGDFQQMMARMPAAAISDLQKGDAVMVVTTQGNGKDPLTIITLLAGVEAILRASPKGGQDMILSPWSLGGGEPSGN